MSKLTDKQRLFVAEYMKDLNATMAAIRAGYSKKTAYSQGQHLLKTVEVKTEIDRLLEERIESAGLDETDWNLDPFIYRDDNYIHRKGIGDLQRFAG